MTTTSDGVAAIRLWTQYHRAIGVELFYMFVNGQVCLVPLMQSACKEHASRCTDSELTSFGPMLRLQGLV